MMLFDPFGLPTKWKNTVAEVYFSNWPLFVNLWVLEIIYYEYSVGTPCIATLALFCYVYKLTLGVGYDGQIC